MKNTLHTLVALSLLVLSTNLYATSIEVSDTISSNVSWTGVDTVKVVGDIVVLSGNTLTIDSGLIVLFQGHYKIKVFGRLLALGSKNNEISFTAANHTVGWNGLLIASVAYAGNEKSVLSNCIFEYGNASGSGDAGNGGSIFFKSWVLDIEYCTFKNNTASGNGGAIYCGNYSTLTITNCIFENNTAVNGGALYCGQNTQELIISNSLFENNDANQSGGAIHFEPSTNILQLINNTIANNTLLDVEDGGGGLCFDDASVVLKNNIIYGNSDVWKKNQIDILSNFFQPSFYYCDIEGGTAAFSGEGFSGTYENNIDKDPDFEGTGIYPYKIPLSSPCANSGDNSILDNIGSFDLKGDPRFMLEKVDMGAYEVKANVDDYCGTALNFDGYSHYVNVPSANSINLTDNFTIEAWIKPNNFDWLSGIVGKYQNANDNGYTLRLSKTSPYSGIEFNGQDTPDGVLEKDRWYHIAAVRSAGVNYVYIDGVEQSLSGSGYSLSQNESPLIIGLDYLTSPRFFDGQIEEVRIWNTPRTAQEIRESMYVALSGTEKNLVSYWQFNDSTGIIAVDSAGLNNGTLNNMGNADWVNSSIPFGSGVSNSQVVASDGIQEFGNTGIKLDFFSKTGTDHITVSRIDTLPNVMPSAGETIIENRYWVINKFGNGSFNAQMKIKYDEGLTEFDEMNPSNVLLFKRNNTSDSSWQFVEKASAVDAENNTVTFDSINEFGQFIVTKNELDHFPGNAIQFCADSNYLFLANENQFDFDTAFTIETWLYVDSMSVNNHTILSKGNAWQLQLIYSDAAIMLEFSINLGGGSISVIYMTDTATMLHKWNHITCVYSCPASDNFINIYLNGIAGTAVSAADLISNNTKVVVGSSFKGRIDELRFWRLTRSTQQIREDMYLSLKYPMTKLVSNLQFNEDSGIFAKDVYGGNNGTFNITDSNVWVNSTIPFGGGYSNTQTEQPGVVSFNKASLSIDFEQQQGASITVSKINTTPNIQPTGSVDMFDKQYWVVNRFGTGNFKGDITFAFAEDVGSKDLDNLSNIVLFSRGSNADTNWSVMAHAALVDTVANTVTFDSITTCGQFIIGRLDADAFPGTALNFDTINGYVVVPDDASLDFSDGLTIEVWINATSWKSLVWLGNILSKEGNHSGYVLSCGDNGRVNFTLGTTDGWQSITSLPADTLLLNTWNHIAVTYNGTNQMIYFNGVLVKQQAAAGTIVANNLSLFIGSNPENTDRKFSGKIDEVRLWDVALDSVQLRDNIYRTLTGAETGLVAYWQFNDGNGTVLSDFSRIHNGTLTNMDADDWVNSTAPMPFVTIQNGNWEDNSIWNTEQNSPIYPWSRAMIKHNVTIDSNIQLIEMTIDTNVTITISAGDTLTVGN